MVKIHPTTELETRLLTGCEIVAGIDEVGRGALAGPVAVGVATIGIEQVESIPQGLADSKLLVAKQREMLAPVVKQWVREVSVGYASAAEIDALGITSCLALAAKRALANLKDQPQMVILDGSHNWLTPREQLALDFGMDQAPKAASDELDDFPIPPVVMRVKADQSCASVAAASIIAKVERDRLMAEMECGYGWDRNAGYGTATHRAQIQQLGLSHQHRASYCSKIVGEDAKTAPGVKEQT